MLRATPFILQGEALPLTISERSELQHENHVIFMLLAQVRLRRTGLRPPGLRPGCASIGPD